MQFQKHPAERFPAFRPDEVSVYFHCQVHVFRVAVNREQSRAVTEEVFENCKMCLVRVKPLSKGWNELITYPTMSLTPCLEDS